MKYRSPEDAKIICVENNGTYETMGVGHVVVDNECVFPSPDNEVDISLCD
ncbi:hypothetical protein [Pseudobacteriovorax antillogorgiicola]|nr:hypothetical protein [Pseudobacteriovorax antillogorgiicola]